MVDPINPQDPLDFLRRVFVLAGGEEDKFPFTGLNLRARHILSDYRGMTLEDIPKPSFGSPSELRDLHQQYRIIYNRAVTAQFAGREGINRLLRDPYTTPLASLEGKAVAVTGSTFSNYIGALEDLGWMDGNGVVRPPLLPHGPAATRSEQAAQARAYLDSFNRRFMGDDIAAMPSTLTDTVGNWLDIVFGHAQDQYGAAMTSRISAHKELLENRLNIETGKLPRTQVERLRIRNRELQDIIGGRTEALEAELRENQKALRKNPSSAASTRLRVRNNEIRRIIKDSNPERFLSELDDLESLSRQISPRDPYTGEPLRHVGSDRLAASRAMQQMADLDPDLVSRAGRLDLARNTARARIRSYRNFYRNVANQDIPGIARAGIFRGQEVTSRIVSGENLIRVGNRWRELSGEELDALLQRERTTLEELQMKGRYNPEWQMMRVTPTNNTPLRNFRVVETGQPALPVRPLDFFTRGGFTNRVVKRPSGRRSAALLDARRKGVDEVIDEATRKLDRAFGSSSQARSYDGIIEGARPFYESVLGGASLTPENLAKNLFAQIIYGGSYDYAGTTEFQSTQKAHRALKYILEQKDSLSTETLDLLRQEIPELRPNEVPPPYVVERLFRQTAEGWNMPADEKMFRAAVNSAGQQILTKDDIRRSVEVQVGSETPFQYDVDAIRNATNDPVDAVTAVVDETTWRRKALISNLRADYRPLLDASEAGEAIPDAMWEKWKMRPLGGDAAETNLFRLFRETINRSKRLTDEQVHLLSRRQSAEAEEAFVRSMAGDPEEARSYFRAVQPYMDPVRTEIAEAKAAEKAAKRAADAANALRREIRNNQFRPILSHFLPPEGVEGYLSSNPLEGVREQVISRFMGLAEDRTTIAFPDDMGLERQFTVMQADPEDDILRLTLADNEGRPLIKELRWNPNEVVDLSDPKKSAAILKDVRNAIWNIHATDIQKEIGTRSGQRFNNLIRDRMAATNELLENMSLDEVARMMGGRGTFVDTGVVESVYVDINRYLMNVDRVNDVTAARFTVGEAMIQHMSEVGRGFGDKSVAATLANQSLFEVSSTTGEVSLARPFVPRVTLEASGATGLIDEVDSGAQSVIQSVIDQLSEGLQARGYSLPDIVNATNDMAKLSVDQVVAQDLKPSNLEVGFARSRRTGLAPPTMAGSKVQIPVIVEGFAEELTADGGQIPMLSRRLSELFAGAVSDADPESVKLPAIGPGQTHLDAMVEAMAGEMDRLGAARDAQVLPFDVQEAVFGARGTLAPRVIPPAKEVSPMVRATWDGLRSEFAHNKTLRAAAIGGAAFLAWGVVSSRRKRDQTVEQVPNLPGGSPMEQSPQGPQPLNMAQPSAAGGGRLYYITAHGSFDPASFQNQVQGITGGNIQGTINSRPLHMQQSRPGVEERLNGI